MGSNETNPPYKKETPMTKTIDQTIKIEEIGNGIFIKWKITTT